VATKARGPKGPRSGVDSGGDWQPTAGAVGALARLLRTLAEPSTPDRLAVPVPRARRKRQNSGICADVAKLLGT
jgi:hypothetical protein